MSENIDSIRAQLWEKMRGKKYRDTFVAAHLSTNIAAQIQTLREARGWTQKQLGEKAKMSQARISVMEDPSYEKITFSTLKRLAAAFDVALVARFVAFSELVDWVADLSPQKMAVPSFDEDSIDRSAVAELERESGLLSSDLQKGFGQFPHAPLTQTKQPETSGGVSPESWPPGSMPSQALHQLGDIQA